MLVRTIAALCAVGAACYPFVASAQTNVAASANGGVASQSSTAFGGPAERANDGNRDGIYNNASVSHTGFEQGAWWQVQFVAVTTIDEILLFNRLDNLGERINTFRVALFLGDTEVWFDAGNTFVEDISGPNFTGMTFDVPQVAADRARVTLEGTNWLHIAELEAYTIPAPASALPLAGVLLALRRRR